MALRSHQEFGIIPELREKVQSLNDILNLFLKSTTGDYLAVGTNNLKTREAWLESSLAEIPAGARILDVGAGEQQYRKFCKQLNYVSQDFAEYDGKGDGIGMHTGTFNYGRLDIISDITNIPEPDASFDAVMCIEVLEHVPNPLAAVVEISRLLKPGGRLILSAPFCSMTHFSPWHFSTGFTRYWYEHHLAKNGLRIVKLSFNGNLFEYLAQEMRRLWLFQKEYKCKPMSWLQKLGIKISLGALAQLSATGKGSEQLLCFGLHVVALKESST